jgi:hypothetical protein
MRADGPDLAVLAAPGDTAVLARNARRHVDLHEETRLIHHEHRTRVAEPLTH